ncbi:hypothetical protein BJX64DRAFT_273246 [Aspergillus heterothallicus]
MIPVVHQPRYSRPTRNIMSAQLKFTIPQEFQEQLEPAEPLDTRSDEEILASLSVHRPVTSEKNIWAFWHAGASKMPKWCQRNVIDWHRICGPSWTIRVLDTVANSPNHALEFIPPHMFPEAFVKGTMDGPYIGQHSADFIRTASLYLYGGVFMDVGILLIRSLDRVCWAQLEDPTTPYNLAVPYMYNTTIANHFVASRKGDTLIKNWHDLFVHVWKDHTNYAGMCENPLFAFMMNEDYKPSIDNGFTFDWKVEVTTVLGYITQVLAWNRVARLEDVAGGFSGVDYGMKHVLWFNVLKENWGIEWEIGFKGENAFNVLATRLDADPESEEYKKAYSIVWRCLAQSSMQKVTHAKNMTETPALGSLWEQMENEGMDAKEGTFAELFRYGATRFRQKREEIAVVQVERPKEIIKKGLYEP